MSEENQATLPADKGQIQLDLEYIRQQKIHFCLPMYGGQCTEATFMSFMKFAGIARNLGITYSVETIVNESLISRARNTLVAKFLASDSTHLMFIDADIGFEPWHVLALLNHKKDVVGGLYPMKTLPVQWVINTVQDGRLEDNGNLVEVSKIGTGFMLVARHVFEKCKEHESVVPFANDIGLDPALDQHMMTYYDTDVRDGRYYSEDWTFCENWRDLGGDIWIDQRIRLKHSGAFVYQEAVQKPLYDRLHTIFGDKQD